MKSENCGIFTGRGNFFFNPGENILHNIKLLASSTEAKWRDRTVFFIPTAYEKEPLEGYINLNPSFFICFFYTSIC